MARPRGCKRLTRKARHIIRHLPRIKFAAVQDQAIHELRHEVSRAHGFRGPKKGPAAGHAGHWRPLTRKAKQLLTRLRKAKVWSVQKQLVSELAKEIEHGRRLADRMRDRAEAAAERMRARMERAKRAGRAVGHGARAAGRKTRNGWNRARPHAAKAGRKFRSTVNRGQEKLLTRAERKQAERGRNPAPRGTLRQRFGPGRARAIWKQRRWERTTPRDTGWEWSRHNPQSPRYRPLPERRRNAGRGPRPVPARRRTPRPARTR